MLFIVVIFFLSKCITVCGTHQVTDVFVNMKNVKDRTGFSRQYTSRSAIQCAGSCGEDTQCHTFSYDKKTKACRLGNASIESARMCRKKGDVAKCSEDKGYLLWMFREAAYCLKFNSAQLSQPQAKQACKDDGGHLTLIDSSDMRDRLREVYEELVGPTTGVVLWFDGYDIGDQDKFMSRKGGDLPWIEWNTGQPQHNPGEDCIGARWDEHFKMRDLYCDSRNLLKSFCQIDLF